MKIPELKAPKSRWGQFWLMFVTECICFFVIVANTRAYTQGNYFWTAVTDTIFSAQGFVMGKLMMDDKEARSWASGAGCTIGGTCGSLLSIWVTKHLFGQ
jgi:hypothetical protein